MFRTMLKSKIHRATVTQADLHYVGSITIDADLMAAADLLPGEPGSGVIGINGAAARLVAPGDLVIVMSYATVTDAEARTLAPRVVLVDAANRVLDTGSDPAAAPPGSGLVRGDRVAAGA